jgi:glycosyltransferase involved in cell wall biosynthesis
MAHELTDKYQGPIKFRYYRHEVNRGISEARNTGVSHAQGDYILFMDSDDWITPGSIDYFISQFRCHPDVDIFIGSVKETKSGSRLLDYIKQPQLIRNRDTIAQYSLNDKIFKQSWNKCVRRRIIQDNKIKFENDCIFEDILWTYEVFCHAESILLLPKVTYVYEYNADSLINTAFGAHKAERSLGSISTIVGRMLENPPQKERFSACVIPEYLIGMIMPLSIGANFLMKGGMSENAKKGFKRTRKHLFATILSYRRALIFLFCLTLYTPLCYLQKMRLYRRNYYRIQQFICRLSHLTDFLH